MLALVFSVLFLMVVGAWYWYRDESVSFEDLSRRYQYQRKFHDESEYEVRASGHFLGPVRTLVKSVPGYENSPDRRIFDSRRGKTV